MPAHVNRARYVAALCATPEGDTIATPDDEALDALITNASPMTGAEYLTADVLIAFCTELGTALRDELVASNRPLQEFLRSLHPIWNLVGRVHFNLAENRKDTVAPFAFLASYTSPVSGPRQSATPTAVPGAGRVLGRTESGTKPKTPITRLSNNLI
jgi:hypothetical protein